MQSSTISTGCGCLLIFIVGFVLLGIFVNRDGNQRIPAPAVKSPIPQPNDTRDATAIAPPVTFPYQFVTTKTETQGNRDVMDLYAFSDTFDVSNLKAFCKHQKQQSRAKVFYYVVIFDDPANATFPQSPFTAEYGIEEKSLRHIRAIYAYNRVNGFSEMRYYKTNAWDGTAVSERL